MKHLKSSLQDLRELYENSIPVKYISEPLASFDYHNVVEPVYQFMELEDYDVIGVRKDGLVCGYAERSNLRGGILENHLNPFEEDDLLTETSPLVQIFEMLEKKPQVFITILGKVGGIVTRGDLQKIPVRMYLFGLISLIEMQLQRIIEIYCPNNNWKLLIKEPRLSKAKEMQEDRNKRNVNIGLLDCLQFSDKRVIFMKINELYCSAGFESIKSGARFLKKLKDFRDQLAHAQHLVVVSWEDTIKLFSRAEELLRRLELIREKN
jgi:hypothetical protein